MRARVLATLMLAGVVGGCSGKSQLGADSQPQAASGSGGMPARRADSGGSAVGMPGMGGRGAESGSGGRASIVTRDADAVGDAGPTDAGARTTSDTGPADLPTACSFTLSGNATIMVGGRVPTDIYMDPNAKQKPAPGGPMIFYWHSMGESSAEVLAAFGQDNIDKVVAMGGVVAAFNSAPPPDAGLGTVAGFWFLEDFEIADEVLACAIRDANIDRKHIHALGTRTGGLQTMAMQLNRANYMASIISLAGTYNPTFDQTNDATNTSSALLTIHQDNDSQIDPREYCLRYHAEQTAKGRFVMLCDTGGGFMIDTNIVPQSLRFFMDNGYKLAPYRGGHIPPEFPSYCTE